MSSNTGVRSLTGFFLKAKVEEFQKTKPQNGSFILSDILGSKWPDECLPFYEMYGFRDKVAGAEMGKVLSKVAKGLGLKSQKEKRFGKVDAITRYFF